ncbi:peptidase M11, partial [Vibrio parahaemolyticus]|nr:peptidase M11 [Vibrio parahaemolyticus]
EVHGSSQSPINAIQSGAKVRARGWKFKDVADKLDALVVADEADGLSVLAQGSTGTVTASTTTSSAALSNTFGEQRTLVLLVNFQDNPQQPWTIDEVQDMVFGKVNDFYKENSFGQTWLS